MTPPPAILATLPRPEGPLLPLAITFPAAVVAVGVLAWYWLRLRQKGIPGSRRRLRRANTMVHFMLVVALVYGLSVVDGGRFPARFAVAWLGVFLLTLLTIGFAIADSLNTYRLHSRERGRRRAETLARLAKARREIAESGGPASTDEDREAKTPGVGA